MSNHLSLAARIASRSTHRQHHHAAIVLRGGAIVAVGHNHGGKYRHAEIAALSKLWPSKRRGCVVWSFRFDKGGNLALAKPCKKCQAAMRECGVRVVNYSTADGFERVTL